MSFLQRAAELFQEQSYDVHQERRKRATLFFAAFAALSVLFSFHTSFLLLHLHTIVSVNHAISLLAIVLCRALGRDVEGQASYPFCFGLRRLTVLLRFAGAVFVVFGCLTTVAEAMHVMLHDEPVNLLLASLAAVLHAIFLLVYRTDVLDADLIAGHGWRVSLQNSFSVQQLQRQLLYGAGEEAASAAALQPASWPGRAGSAGDSGGGGGLGSEALAPRRRYSLPRSLWQQMQRRLWRGVRRAADTLRLLLLPLCSLVCCLTSAFASTAHIDVWFALGLALYYLIAGLREGRCMAWHLLNNGVQHDPVLRRLISNTLQKVELMDGVLQVQTSVWWAASPDQLVAMLRVRLMSGADPSLVTAAVRRALRRVAVFAFVECLPVANPATRGAAATALIDDDDEDAGFECDGTAASRRGATACHHGATVPAETTICSDGSCTKGEAATLTSCRPSADLYATRATPQPALFTSAAARASGGEGAQTTRSGALPACAGAHLASYTPASGATLTAPTPAAFPAPVTGVFADTLGGTTNPGHDVFAAPQHGDTLGVSSSNNGSIHFPPPPVTMFLGSPSIV